MSAVDYQRSECGDEGPFGYKLASAAALGGVEFSYDVNAPLVPIAIFSGAVNSWLVRPDGGVANWADIFGTEVQVRAAERGLTFGGWFWWSALPGAVHTLIAKDNFGPQRQYSLYTLAANTIQFTVSPGPVVVVSAATINVGWNHIVGVYDQPNQDLHVILNGAVTSNLGAAPAALNDSTANFAIGASSAGNLRFTGYASMCFLCASSVSLAQLYRLYELSAPLFGLKPQVVG